MGDAPGWELNGDKRWLEIAIRFLVSARDAMVNSMAHNVDVDPRRYTHAIDRLEELMKHAAEIKTDLEKVG
jgi:hypothetical protein